MSENMCRSVMFSRIGDASVLELITEPERKPSIGEVRIAVEAIGLNRAEVMFREGTYLEQPEFPARVGYEAAGVIEAVGEGVSGFEVGDRVSTIPAFSMGTHGVYSEKAIVPAHSVARYPENLSAKEGSSIWMQYLTAYGALIDIAKLEPGQVVLITAASSSVGLAAIQVARAVGATVIVTTRGTAKLEALRVAGADHVISTDSENLVERVTAITAGAGAQVIFDSIAGPIIEELATAAASGAMLIEYGALDDRQTPFPLYQALAKGLTIRGYTLFEITQDAKRLNKAKAYIYEGFETGALVPVLDRNFAFEDVADAHRYMESNQQLGKITLTL